MDTDHAGSDAGPDRLVAALVSWGATASQIVTHMEQTRRSGASCASASTIEVFTSLVGQVAGPVVAAAAEDADAAATLVEAIDEAVGEEILMVPLPRSRADRRARRRRP